MHRNREKKSYLRRIGSVLLALAVMACTVQISGTEAHADDGYTSFNAEVGTLYATKNLTFTGNTCTVDYYHDSHGDSSNVTISLEDVSLITLDQTGILLTFERNGSEVVGHSGLTIQAEQSECSMIIDTDVEFYAGTVTNMLVLNRGISSIDTVGTENKPCSVDNYKDLNASSIYAASILNHQYGYVCAVNSINATAVENDDNLKCSSLTTTSLTNTGIIQGGDLTIPEGTTSSASAVYDVSERIFLKDCFSDFGTILARSGNTKVIYQETVDTMRCDLQIGSGTVKTINIYPGLGGVTEYKASYLMKDEPTFSGEMPATLFAGTDCSPLNHISTNSDGAVSVQYFREDPDHPGETEYLSAQPTTSGDYGAIITVAETQNYREATYVVDSFRLRYLSTDGSMYVTFNQSPAVNRDPYYYYNSPVVLTASPGYEISVSHSAFSSTYRNATDGYYNGTTGQFRRTSDGALTSPGVWLDSRAYYLDQKAPSVKESSILLQNGTGEKPVIKDGAVIRGTQLEFDIVDKMFEGRDSLESVTVNGVPVTVENYGEYAHVSLTAVKGVEVYRILALDTTHNPLEMTISLDARKDVTALKLLMGDAVYGASYSDPIVETESNATDYAFYYKKKGADESTYSKEKPTEVGEYDVKAEIPATDLYQAATATTTFAIVKQELHPTISMGTCLVGTAFSPTVTNVPEDAQVSILYKQADAGEDAWTADLPRVPGTYTVKASVEAGATYEATAVTTDFDLTWLEAPKTTYAPTGTKGNGGYYTTDLYLTAPEGFEIASAEGEFGAKLLYSDGLKTYRLRRVEDGALTGELTLTEEFEVDKDAQRTGAAVDQDGKLTELVDGMSIYASSLSFTILDDHLAKVTVDGKPVEITNHQAKILLEVGKRKKSFTVVAEDEAGNTYTYYVTLKAPWMEHRYIPAGSPIPLEAGQSYTFGDGYWIVEGDTTVYSGGMRFYVKNDGDYTFEQTR